MDLSRQPKDAELVLRIVRDVLGIAAMKLDDASDWLSAPGVPMTGEQRAQADALLRQVEIAQAAIAATR